MADQRPYDVIIVALDEDRSAGERALSAARGLARAFDAHLVLVRAAADVTPSPDPPLSTAAAPLPGPPGAAGLGGLGGVPYPTGGVAPTVAADITPTGGELPHHIRNAEDTGATGELNILSNRLRDEGYTIEEIEAVEDIASAVIDEGRARARALIVLGARHQGGLERLLSGSIADKVLRHAPCPVLVIPE